jgi:putative restriction endonuclease
MKINKKIAEFLTSLNANKNKNWSDKVRNQAPHKPFLLLSILDGVKQGWITSNKIELNQKLIDTFFIYWNGIMGEDKITTIALPFYHMGSEPIWELRYIPGKNEFTSSPSTGGLLERVRYAVILPELFELMISSESRVAIQSIITQHYFDADTAGKVAELSSFNYDANRYEQEFELLTRSAFVTHHTSVGKSRITTVSKQVREKAFYNNIRKYYNYTCSICKSKVITPNEHYIVEGAHIIPWSESFNDDPRNGISLCRNHHWLFDKHMLTIRSDYKIQLSPWLNREINQWDEYKKISGSEILLPSDSKFYPASEALKHHNEKFERIHNDI